MSTQVSLEVEPVTVSLLSREPFVHQEVYYEVSVLRRFWPGSDHAPKWRISFYDPLTGTEVTAVNHEDAILRHAPFVELRPAATYRPKPANRTLVHQQACLVQENVNAVACAVQVYACTPHDSDGDKIVFFDLIFLAGFGHP